MGRPLFVARVESRIPSSEKTASHARSPIRRRSRRGGSAAGARAPSATFPVVPNLNRSEEMEPAAHHRHREVLSQMTGAMDDTASHVGDSIGLRPRRDVEAPPFALHWDFRTDSERVMAREHMHRLLHQPSRFPQALRAADPSSPPGGRSSASRLGSRRVGLPDQASTRASSFRTRRAFGEYVISRGDAGFDGLGDRDRDRILSPEGAHVWDTLLTSITPDPQPPSLGSSFASTAASQSAAGSAATSFTEPDLNPETALGADQGCESGAEDQDTSDAEDDEDLMPAISSGFRRHIPRSHPSARHVVPPRVPESGNDSIDGMMGMIRQLAQHHNVPASFLEDMESLRRERQSSH